MHPLVIIALIGLVGIGLGIVLARSFRKSVLIALWAVLSVVGVAVWIWGEAQPGLDGLVAVAIVLLIVLPALGGSLLGALVIWVRAGARRDEG